MDRIWLEQKVLAQDGEPGSVARKAKVIRMALKGGLVGQNRDAAGASFQIGARQSRRIEVGTDQTFRRTGFFNFCDQGGTAFAEMRLNRGRETAWRRCLSGALHPRLTSYLPLRATNLPAPSPSIP